MPIAGTHGVVAVSPTVVPAPAGGEHVTHPIEQSLAVWFQIVPSHAHEHVPVHPPDDELDVPDGVPDELEADGVPDELDPHPPPQALVGYRVAGFPHAVHPAQLAK